MLSGTSLMNRLNRRDLARAVVLVTGLLLAITGVARSEELWQGKSTAGPLRPHPTNPRYFTDGTRNPDGSLQAVYQTGSHTWNNLVDMGRNDPPESFDFDAYLDFLERHEHNFIRLWAWDSTTWDTRANGRLGKDFVHIAAPLPWARTGPGEALDGNPKFDLMRFDPEYFKRLRRRVSAANRRGIFVSVMLFEGWGLMHGNRGRAAPEGWAWRSHPFHPDNNVNGIDASVDGDPITGAVHRLGNESVKTNAEWIHPTDGTITQADPVAGGAKRTLKSPFPSDVAVHIWKEIDRTTGGGGVHEPLPRDSAEPVSWKHLSSTRGELPVPGESTQQTGSIVADLDKDGVNDFVLSFRKVAPALVWYRRGENGWTRSVIEQEFLPVEAGGAAHDIDGDGDIDIVFGGDYQSNEVWWWENPLPDFNSNVSWKRHIIKKGGKTQHHDQIFGNFRGTGKPQLAFWNQGAKTIFLADVPADPRRTEPWPAVAIFSGEAGEARGKEAARYAEGMAAADIDADGKVDLVAGNSWFKHTGGNQFMPIQIGAIGGRVAVGRFKPARFPQLVIAPGDGIGPLTWYECNGDPTRSADWVGHELVARMVHGHTLDVGDIDGDGHVDIFAAEMAKWTESRPDPDNPQAKAWVFYGDGQGNFHQTELVTGHGWHEGRLADLNGDGTIDILNKPYNWQAPRVDVWLNQVRSGR